MEKSKQLTRYGAYAIILKDSHVLLTQKKSGPYIGLWDLPGGGIEFGETPEWTLKREIKEETALMADQLELLTVMTNYDDYLDSGNAYKFHHIGIIYRVNQISFLPHVIAEEKKRWITFQALIPEELTPFAKQAYLDRLFWR